MRYTTSQQRLDQAVQDRAESFNDAAPAELKLARSHTDPHYERLPIDVKTLVTAEVFYERAVTALRQLRRQSNR